MHNMRLRTVIGALAALAAVAITTTLLLDPLPTGSDWWIAFATLFGLSIASGALALRVTEGGTHSSMDFIPHLAAMVLLGPSGTTLLALGSWPIFQTLILNKPYRKTIFNTAQMSIAAAAASWVFVIAGGSPSFTNLGFPGSLIPFFLGAIVYFGINSTSVALVISIEEEERFSRTWSSLAGRLVGFDLFMSPLAYGVAYLDIRFGHVLILLALVPLFGLRYTYGVNLELQNLNTDLLRTLMRMVESQDPYTSGHSVRVATYSSALSEELNIGMGRSRNIERAALLHDLGKVDRAYREILVQEGPLSEEQRELVEEHPDRGVELLQSVRSIDPDVLKAIRHHHERYDGNGYPEGVEGENIPIGARIIMVADTIDAMLTARSYRDALGKSVVKEELEENAGEQFDPKVVEAALEIGLVERAAQLIEQQKEADMDPVASPVDLPDRDEDAGIDYTTDVVGS